MSKLTIRILMALIFLFCSEGARAQSDSITDTVKPYHYNFAEWCREHNVATSLDAGISLSSMGIGLEVKTPVTRWLDIRAGVDWMPKVSLPMSFNLNTYSDGMPTGNFNRVAGLLYDLTGMEVDETVNMKGSGTMVNFKFMADFFPFQANRHWHVTVGFFAGTAKIAKAINTKDEKPTLVALNIYNRAYEYFTDPETVDVPLGGDSYLNPDLVDELKDKFKEYGRMGVHIGDFKNGKPYIMEPAPDGSISAKAFVNHFKPYVGLGYSTDLDKDKRWHFSVDAGVIFWGGDPKVINYDYSNNREINFTKDLTNIRGKVGSYMKIVRALPVYPLLAFRFSYSIL